MTLDIFMASMAAVGVAAALIFVLTRKGLPDDRQHRQVSRSHHNTTAGSRRH